MFSPPSRIPLRRQIRKRFDARGIFLNIPYAVRYTRLELAVIATATAYGLRPVLAKQQVVFDVRFKRILELITSCAFGFTDLSYEKRMNMPFELGIMMAMGKDCFIVSRRKYSGLASISDLSLGDIHYHEADPHPTRKGILEMDRIQLLAQAPSNRGTRPALPRICQAAEGLG